MNSHARKLLTIITEAALESVVTQDIERLGAHGYTVSDARGKGGRGVRRSDWDASSNIRIEIVCNEEAADAIAAHMSTHYYENYAMILFVTNVLVLRAEKF